MEACCLTIAYFAGRHVLRGLRDIHDQYGGSTALTLLIYHVSRRQISYAEHLPGIGRHLDPTERLGLLRDHALRLAADSEPVLYREERVELPDSDDLWLVRYGDFVCACAGSVDDAWDKTAAKMLASWCQFALHRSEHLYTQDQIDTDAVLGFLHDRACAGLEQIKLIPNGAKVLPVTIVAEMKEELPPGSSSTFSRTLPFRRLPSSLPG